LLIPRCLRSAPLPLPSPPSSLSPAPGREPAPTLPPLRLRKMPPPRDFRATNQAGLGAAPPLPRGAAAVVNGGSCCCCCSPSLRAWSQPDRRRAAAAVEQEGEAAGPAGDVAAARAEGREEPAQESSSAAAKRTACVFEASRVALRILLIYAGKQTPAREHTKHYVPDSSPLHSRGWVGERGRVVGSGERERGGEKHKKRGQIGQTNLIG